MASSNASMRNRDDYRKAKELEEARKAGIAPAAVDEDGKEINPHIPQYMSTAPWYLNSEGPTLKHQRNWNEKKKEQKDWYDRGAKGFQATKYRKGACQNCGAMTHTTKECTERPRARGARWTNKQIAADEKIQDIKLSYEGKRDRWNGYDSREYAKVQNRYEKIEALKQEEAKKRELEEKFSKKGEEDGLKGEADGGDFLLKDEEETGFAKVEKRVRTTAGGATGSVRNLRIREDTAKYLFNLDLASAHYDPKSRSMRADPNPEVDDSAKRFRGDAHLLKKGEVQAWERLMHYSHQNDTNMSNAHLQALPSQAELLYKDFKSKKEKINSNAKTNIHEKYGNAASTDNIDKRLLHGQTERYVEYNRRGQVVVGEEAKVCSKYEEDVYINNHTAVWGSWWEDGTWGYACCRQTVKNSYCTGVVEYDNEVEEANVAVEERKFLKRVERPGTENKARTGTAIWEEPNKDLKLDDEKLKLALKKFDKDPVERDEKKRGFNSLGQTGEITEEEMEAYRMKRVRAEDPMLNFKSDDVE